MFKRVANSLPQKIALTIAGMIRKVQVNRVTFQTIDDREFVCKQRHPFSWLLIFPGNLVLRWRKVPVRVLPTQQWMEWERTIAPVDHEVEELAPRTLTLAKIEGSPLAKTWSTSDVQTDQKLEIISVATAELLNFHQRHCYVPGLGQTPISHGDATIRNVMIDQTNQTATWFDFDLQHDMQINAVARHADDLRALLFSAAHFFPVDDLKELVRITRNSYDQPDVWNELSAQIISRWFGFDLFHLAHTRPLSPPIRDRQHQVNDLLTAQNDKTRTLIRAVCNANNLAEG